MVFFFLTACLEPGKDGVGDYTRRLASACAQQKHECHLLALNDHQITEPVERTETVDGHSLSILRLPSTMNWQQRIERACAFRLQHPPDRISLQVVSYGFSPRGIVRGLASHLAPIIADTSLQLMFHELWIGIGRCIPLKERLVGKVQRHYLRQLVRQLRPRWVNTSNPYYLSLLDGLSSQASLLPLFGNIPVQAGEASVLLPEPLVSMGWDREESFHHLNGLFFGAIPPPWQPEPFIGILLAAAQKKACRPRLISAGRRGRSGEIIWEQMQRDYGDRIDFLTLGELPVSTVSTLLQRADFGVATSPWLLLGKSGSAAAMLDHGLPVIVTRDDFQPGFASPRPTDPLLHACDAHLEKKLIAGLPKGPVHERLPEIARMFLQQLA